jgi:hypothetical protein
MVVEVRAEEYLRQPLKAVEVGEKSISQLLEEMRARSAPRGSGRLLNGLWRKGL